MEKDFVGQIGNGKQIRNSIDIAIMQSLIRNGLLSKAGWVR